MLITLPCCDGDLTTAIQCPICGNQILGNGERKLSINLQDHMTEVHELNLMGEKETGITEGFPGELREGRNERPTQVAVRCPICGEELNAETDERLSSELSHHMLNEHEVVRRLAGWASSR